MALFTFGEGYHNYHHEFQHDYRNGVKAWQFDPTKWTIGLLNKVGLARSLRRVPSEKILLAQLGETQRRVEANLSTMGTHDAAHGLLLRISERLQQIAREWEQYSLKQIEVTREMLASLQKELRAVVTELKTLNLPACTSAS